MEPDEDMPPGEPLDTGSELGDDDLPLVIGDSVDIPHPSNAQDLVAWLQSCDEQLPGIHVSMGPTRRGVYHSNKIGKEPSLRTQQRNKKNARERETREMEEDSRNKVKRTKINQFFSTRKPSPPPADLDTISVDSDSDIEEISPPDTANPSQPCDDGMLVDSEFSDSPPPKDDEPVEPAGSASAESASCDDTAASHRIATVEEVEDEEENSAITTEPLQLSFEAMAEEGLDELPWDPPEALSPRSTNQPLPEERVQRPVIDDSSSTTIPTSPTPLAIPRDEQVWNPDREQGFTMPN